MQRSIYKSHRPFVYRWESKEPGWAYRPDRDVPLGTDGKPLSYLTPVRSSKSAKVLTCRKRVLGSDQSRSALRNLRVAAERSR